MNSITRRRLLALLSASAVTTACKDPTVVASTAPIGGPSPSDVPVPTPFQFDLDAWFDALGVIQEGVRQSPDHLQASAERLVAAADAAGLHQLVQQQIRLIPVNSNRLADAETMHWGPQNALRCGAGTAREKAELLNDLLLQAGFQSEIYDRPLRLEAPKIVRMLTAGIETSFDPVFDDAQLQLLAAGPAFEEDERLAPPTDAEVSALADALEPQVPWSTSPDWLGESTNDVLPLVKATVGGEEVWLDPIDPDAAYGERSGSATPTLLIDPAVLPEVEVSLLWTRAEDTRVEEVLVQHTWSADKVVGRTLSASFAPVAGMNELLFAPVSAHRIWSPILAFTNRVVEEDVIRGEPFSVRGEPVEIDVNAGTVTWDGTPIDLGGDAALADTVARVEMRVRPGSWPEIGVRVAAFDAAGAPVVGLGAPQFELLEEGEPLRPAVTGNSRTTRRIFVIVDQSTSVDEAFRGPGATAVIAQIFDDLSGVDAEWVVGGIRPTTVPEGDFSSVRAEVLAMADLSANASGNSTLWHAILDAAEHDVDAIILISDGQATDLRADIDAAQLSNCPPVIAMQVTGASPDGSMEEIAQSTGGIKVDVDDTLATLGAVSAALEAPLEVFYDLMVASPKHGPSTRTLQLQIGSAPVVEATYEVPVTAAEVRPITPVSLRLRIRVGSREVTRVLAGLPNTSGRVNDPIRLAEAAAQVRLGLAHGGSLSFEGASPPLAQVIDEAVDQRLQSRPMMEWLQTSDLDTLADALDASTLPRPRAIQVMLHTLINPIVSDVPVYPLGLQVVLQRTSREFISDTEVEVTSITDVLPLASWHAYGHTAVASRRATLEHTIRLALLEGALPGDSTNTLLEGIPLVAMLAFRSIGQVVSGLDDATEALWEETLEATRSRYTHLVPADGTHLGAWAIDADTGALIGLIPGGAGGSSAQNIHAFLETMMGIASFSAGLLGAPASVGAFMAYIVWQIRMWGIATACVGSLFVGTPMRVDQARIRDELNEMLCNVVKAFAIAPLRTIDLALGLYDAMAGVYGSKGICGLIVELD